MVFEVYRGIERSQVFDLAACGAMAAVVAVNTLWQQLQGPATAPNANLTPPGVNNPHQIPANQIFAVFEEGGQPLFSSLDVPALGLDPESYNQQPLAVQRNLCLCAYLLNNGDRYAQAFALSTLEDMHGFAQPAVPLLTQVLKGNDEFMRIGAGQALDSIGIDCSEAVPDLVVALEDPCEKVRVEAADGLASVYSEEALSPHVQTLVRVLLETDDKDIRTDLIWAIKHAGTAAKGHVEELIRLAGEVDNEFNKEELISTIATIDPGHPSFMPLLHDSLKKRECLTKVAWAIEKIGPDAAFMEQDILAALREDKEPICSDAKWLGQALFASNPNRDYSQWFLTEFINQTDPALRYNMLEALSQGDGKNAQTASRMLSMVYYNWKDEHLTWRAGDALAELGRRVPMSVPQQTLLDIAFATDVEGYRIGIDLRSGYAVEALKLYGTRNVSILKEVARLVDPSASDERYRYYSYRTGCAVTLAANLYCDLKEQKAAGANRARSILMHGLGVNDSHRTTPAIEVLNERGVDLLASDRPLQQLVASLEQAETTRKANFGPKDRLGWKLASSDLTARHRTFMEKRWWRFIDWETKSLDPADSPLRLAWWQKHLT